MKHHHQIKFKPLAIILTISSVAVLTSITPACTHKKNETAKSKTEQSSSAFPKKVTKQTTKKQKSKLAFIDLGEETVFKNVRLPRYDKNFNPISLLTAEKLTVIDSEHIDGEALEIDLFNPDRSVKLQTKMKRASYNNQTSILRASEAIFIKAENSTASGTGLIFQWNTSRGFLLGPITTLFQKSLTKNSKKTAVIPWEKPQLSASTTHSVAGTLIALSTAIMATPPAQVTPAELTEIDQLAAPMSETITRTQEQTSHSLTQEAELTSAANATMTPFLKSIGQDALLITTAPTAPTQIKTPPPEAIEKKNSKQSNQQTLRVECDGGLYFDSDTGVLAYLKNIRLTEARFLLSCRDELKVFLEQKPKNDTEKKDTGLGSFGGLKRIIASGDVKVTRKDENGKLFVATAETMSYNALSGDMILRGGLPRLQIGTNQYLQSKAPGQHIRILKNGKLITNGKWEMQVNTKQ